MPATGLHASPGLRRTLVALGGTVLAVIGINGLIAVFGLYYVNEAHMRSLAELDRLMETLNVAGSAQVHFKKQVQEWKDVLLRGDDPADYAKYKDAFDREQQLVRDELQSLTRADGSLDIDRIRALIQDHERLEKLYVRALTKQPTSLADARAIDDMVRGIDRPLTDDLDDLAGEINARVDAAQTAGRAADAQRYATLRMLVMSATGVCIGLVLVLLVVVLRNSDKR